MKCIKVDLPDTLKEVRIEIFSDLHIGSKKCDYNLINERIESVKNSDNTYWVGIGDFLNNSIKTSVGDVYEEELSPMQQIQTAVKMFEPIKDKCICLTAGNHERRTMKQDNIDLMQFFATELGIPDKYDYVSCLVFLRFGMLNSHHGHRKVLYTIYCTHGDGIGGKTAGGKANGLQKRGQIVDSDIVIIGHTHSPLSFRDSFYRIDLQSSTVKKVDQLFVNASATLGYEEYAEMYGMKPSSCVSPKIVLDGNKKASNVIM